MTAPAIIDFIAAGVLVLFTLFGARRGLFRALAGLAIVVLSLTGASLAAGTLAPPAARLAAPVIEKRLEARLDEAIAARFSQEEREALEANSCAPLEEQLSPEELLALLGIDEKQREDLAARAGVALEETGRGVMEAVVESAAQSVIHGVLYIVFFFAASFLLTAAARAVDLMLRLPVLHEANALLGAAAGLIEGLLLLLLAAVILRQLGLPLGQPPWSESHFFRIFTAVR